MSMKVEFVMETTADGSTQFFTEVNGSYVAGSLSRCEDKARAVYERVVANGGASSRTVLASHVESSEVQP
jgi:hypothetical protein